MEQTPILENVAESYEKNISLDSVGFAVKELLKEQYGRPQQIFDFASSPEGESVYSYGQNELNKDGKLDGMPEGMYQQFVVVAALKNNLFSQDQIVQETMRQMGLEHPLASWTE